MSPQKVLESGNATEKTAQKVEVTTGGLEARNDGTEAASLEEDNSENMRYEKRKWKEYNKWEHLYNLTCYVCGRHITSASKGGNKNGGFVLSAILVYKLTEQQDFRLLVKKHMYIYLVALRKHVYLVGHFR